MLNHRNGISNKVVDVFRRKQNLLTNMTTKVVGFQELKHLYEDDPDFMEAWRECNESISKNRQIQLSGWIT